MDKIIFGVTGEMASGKGIVAKYLSEKHGARTYKYSSLLRELLDTADIEKSRKNLTVLGTKIREMFGRYAMTDVLIWRVLNSEEKIIVVEGIRHKDEVEAWKRLKNFTLIAVDADTKIRYDRLTARNENAGDAEKSFEEFAKDSEAGTEEQIVETIAAADEKITNNTTMEEFLAQVDTLVKKYSK
ncbi:MAG: AAA family ATPase [Patescibacteria group bacterium]|jgi:dephospho-CoA kinase